MLKEKVSGKRNRYKDHRFNLDLTYITDWVIAMSYPASGLFERTYRNSIKEVRTLDHQGLDLLTLKTSSSFHDLQHEWEILWIWRVSRMNRALWLGRPSFSLHRSPLQSLRLHVSVLKSWWEECDCCTLQCGERMNRDDDQLLLTLFWSVHHCWGCVTVL